MSQMASILASPHFLVVDRCFTLLKVPKLQEYVRRHSAAVIRELYPVLRVIVRDHWNQQLQNTALWFQQKYQTLNAAVCQSLATPPLSTPLLPAASPWSRLEALAQQPEAPKAPVRAKSRPLDLETARMLAKYHPAASRSVCKENVENK
jgi:hypothetical protein